MTSGLLINSPLTTLGDLDPYVRFYWRRTGSGSRRCSKLPFRTKLANPLQRKPIHRLRQTFGRFSTTVTLDGAPIAPAPLIPNSIIPAIHQTSRFRI
jgi:hypothetical protein